MPLVVFFANVVVWQLYWLWTITHSIIVLYIKLLLSCLMGQYCFARGRLSSSVTLPAGGRAGYRARGRSAAAGPGAWAVSGDRHCTAGQYGYIPLGRNLVFSGVMSLLILHHSLGITAVTAVVAPVRCIFRRQDPRLQSCHYSVSFCWWSSTSRAVIAVVSCSSFLGL